MLKTQIVLKIIIIPTIVRIFGKDLLGIKFNKKKNPIGLAEIKNLVQCVNNFSEKINIY